MKKLLAFVLCASMLAMPAAAFTFEEVDTDQAFSDEVKQAEAVSDWALAEVEAADKLGLIVPSCASYMTGNITREQFAELAVNLVELAQGITIYDQGTSPYTDCDNPEVIKASSLGLVKGVGGGRFDPDGILTREQLATMLYRTWQHIGTDAFSDGLAGYTDAGDISPWASEAMGVLVTSGIMKGTSNTTLTPQGPCTIEQSVLLVYRLYQQVTTAS